MKKIIKKAFLGTLLLATSCVTLASCNNKIDLDGENNATVTESYPYMDKMYRNVYLIGNPTDLKSSLWTHGVYTIDTCISKSISSGDESGIAVRFKEGTRLRSITFSVKTLKACYVNPYISGYTIEEIEKYPEYNGIPKAKYTYATGGNWQEKNETKTYTVTFGNGEKFRDPLFKKTRTWVNFNSSTTDIQKCVGFGAINQNIDFKDVIVHMEFSNVSFTFD